MKGFICRLWRFIKPLRLPLCIIAITYAGPLIQGTWLLLIPLIFILARRPRFRP